MTTQSVPDAFHSFPAWQGQPMPDQRHRPDQRHSNSKSTSEPTVQPSQGHDAQGQLTRPIRRVLVSVSDKSGLQQLGKALAQATVEVVSTGATAEALRQAGVAVSDVSQVTGFPEILQGRVKTLHPHVHAGLLADMTNPEHSQTLADQNIAAFDALVVNLYPFTQTVASGASPEHCVENIDIGGPAMIRAAAKNYRSVTVITDVSDYPALAQACAGQGFTLQQRHQLAARAFAHTASYDSAIAQWMAHHTAPEEVLPSWMGATWRRRDMLRYGENPHQSAALFVTTTGSDVVKTGVAQGSLLHGKAMSYNNYVDADAAVRAVDDFEEPCVAIIKHNNPCGIAVAPELPEDDHDHGQAIARAHQQAHACDPLSAFGGVIAANRPISEAMAKQIAPVFTEVVVAPGFHPQAVEILTEKKNIRLLQIDATSRQENWQMLPISGGLLVQEWDRLDAPGDEPSTWTLACGQPVDEATLADLQFAWRACRAVKSNAIVLAHNGATVGVGMGQVNRLDSARLAVSRAEHRAAGSVAASDGFFPFADGLTVLLEAGVRAVVQPGGSLRDDEVIAAAAQAEISLYLTGTRHFAH